MDCIRQHREFIATAPSGRTVAVYQPDETMNIVKWIGQETGGMTALHAGRAVNKTNPKYKSTLNLDVSVAIGTE